MASLAGRDVHRKQKRVVPERHVDEPVVRRHRERRTRDWFRTSVGRGPPAASISQRPRWCRRRSDTNRMWRLSGRHVGMMLSNSSASSTSGSPPAAGIIISAPLPLRAPLKHDALSVERVRRRRDPCCPVEGISAARRRRCRGRPGRSPVRPESSARETSRLPLSADQGRSPIDERSCPCPGFGYWSRSAFSERRHGAERATTEYPVSELET